MRIRAAALTSMPGQGGSVGARDDAPLFVEGGEYVFDDTSRHARGLGPQQGNQSSPSRLPHLADRGASAFEQGQNGRMVKTGPRTHSVKGWIRV
jgi:hypothetical protein